MLVDVTKPPEFLPPPQPGPRVAGPPQQPPRHTEYSPAMPPSPAGPPPRRGNGPLVGVLVSVIVVLMALVAWLIIRPVNGKPSTPTPSPTIGAGPSQSSTGSFSAAGFGSMTWSVPLNMGSGGYVNVSDSGVDGIVAVSTSDGMVYAVDLTTMRGLWSKPGMVYSPEVSPGPVSGGIVLFDWNSLPDYFGDLVDPRSGNVIWHSGTNNNISAIGGGYIVTQQITYPISVTVCARKASSPDSCLWQASLNPDGLEMQYQR